MNLFNGNNKEVLKSLLRQSEILNTINGGCAMTKVDTKEENGNLVIMIYAPTVKAEAYNIILNQNSLVVFSVLTLGTSESIPEELVNVPMFTRSFPLPKNVDEENIEAIHENGELRVIIPLQKWRPLPARRIKIKQI